MEEEKLKRAINTIGSIYGEISNLLGSTNPPIGSAAYGMLKDSKGVKQYAENVLATSQFTRPELNMLTGVIAGFSRHLSEVEQTVYEEIGEEKYEQIKPLVSRDGDAYNIIYYYPASKETE